MKKRKSLPLFYLNLPGPVDPGCTFDASARSARNLLIRRRIRNLSNMEASGIRQDGRHLQAIAVDPFYQTKPTRTAIKTITNLQPVDSSAPAVVASKSKQQVRARMDINLTEGDNGYACLEGTRVEGLGVSLHTHQY